MLASKRVAAPAAATRASASRRAVVVKAQAGENTAAKVAAAAAAAAVLSLGAVDAAKAEISGLTPCSESKAYAKRLKNEVKGLNKRLKGVRRRAGSAAGSTPLSCDLQTSAAPSSQ
jgi:photosystem I subunit 3